MIVASDGVIRFAKSRTQLAWFGDGFVRTQHVTIPRAQRIKDITVTDSIVAWCEEDEEDPTQFRGYISPIDRDAPQPLGPMYAVLARGEDIIAVDMDLDELCLFSNGDPHARRSLGGAGAVMLQQMLVVGDRLYWSVDSTLSSLSLSSRGDERIELSGGHTITDLGQGLALVRVELTANSGFSTLSILDGTERVVTREESWAFCPRMHAGSLYWMRRREAGSMRQLVCDGEVIREDRHLWGLVMEGDHAYFASSRGIERIDL